MGDQSDFQGYKNIYFNFSNDCHSISYSYVVLFLMKKKIGQLDAVLHKNLTINWIHLLSIVLRVVCGYTFDMNWIMFKDDREIVQY